MVKQNPPNLERRRSIWIDPGLRATGVALLERGEIVDCALARSRNSYTGEPDLYGALDVADEVVEWISRGPARVTIDLVGIEWPHVRPPEHRRRGRKGVAGQVRDRKEDPNDLLVLPLVHGAILSRLRPVLPGVRFVAISADEWTNGVPKEIRQDRSWGEYSPAERVIVERIQPPSLRHNTRDSIDLGKWGSFRPRFESLVRRSTLGAFAPLAPRKKPGA